MAQERQSTPGQVPPPGTGGVASAAPAVAEGAGTGVLRVVPPGETVPLEAGNALPEISSDGGPVPGAVVPLGSAAALADEGHDHGQGAEGAGHEDRLRVNGYAAGSSSPHPVFPEGHQSVQGGGLNPADPNPAHAPVAEPLTADPGLASRRARRARRAEARAARRAFEAAHPRRRRRQAMRASLWSLALLAVMAGAALFALLALTGRPIPMPVFVVAEAEARMNAALGPAMPGASISLGGIEVMVDRDWQPRLRLADLRLMQAGGGTLMVLPDARIAFDGGSMLRGRILPRDLRLTGARIAVHRDAEGRFDISLGDGSGAQLDSFAALLDAVDAGFATPALAKLNRIEADALTVQMRDDRTGRAWTMGDGRLVLANQPDQVAAELSMSLVGGETAGQARLVAVSEKRESRARLTVSVNGLAAADVASQAAPLAFLGALDAPLSGEVTASLDADGISGLDGRFEIGAGALQPQPDATPISFNRAGVTIGYDAAKGRVNLTEISVDGPSARVTARGYADLVDAAGKPMTGGLGGRLPAGFVAQVAFDKAMVDPAGVFERPVVFTAGAVDLRLGLAPFGIEVGQLSLIDDRGTRLSARGRVGAGPGGWQVAMDFAVNHISRDRLLQLWPVRVVPKTRDWMAKNLLEGELTDLKAGLRLTPGQAPRLALTWDFTDAELRFIKTLPPVAGASGYATMEGSRYTTVVTKGRIMPPEGGPIDVAGSVFHVGDITEKPAKAEVSVQAESSVTAILSLLDQPPFQFLTKAKRPVTLADGRARAAATLRFPLKPKVTPQEVSYAVTGEMTGVSSSVLVPGKVIEADRLAVSATNRGLQITGPARIGAASFTGTFDLPFGREHEGRSSLKARAEISPATLDEFDIALPKGAVSGSGPAEITLDFVKDTPPRLHLTSALQGIGLSVPEIGWSKGRGSSGKLELDAVLSKPVQVERLSLSAAGLKAEGSLRMGAEGLDLASLSRVQVGGWLDAPVDLRGRGKGRSPAVAVKGGTLDLRRLDSDVKSAGGSGGGAARQGTPISVALDRLVITDSLSLTGVRGDFSTTGGLNGDFTGRVNGAAPVSGTVVPAPGGSAIRVGAQDAGAVLAAAGIFRSLRGGTLSLQLLPRPRHGSYDGLVSIDSFRVQDAPVLAELLSAISVVGLLEQLGGSGIAFMGAEGSFVLTPDRLVLTHGAATGASMGVSLAGSYDFAGKRLDMQGVISPIYMLNAVGQLISKRGEGLFGFNYKLRGTSDQPKVTVNPLSILTPGMFREIFRKPPPGVKADE